MQVHGLPGCHASEHAAASQGVEFQEVQEYWSGDKFRCLGAGTRVKKLGGFIPVKARETAHKLSPAPCCAASSKPVCAGVRVWPVRGGSQGTE